MSSGVDMLTNSLKVSDTNKEKLSTWFPFRLIKKYDKNTAVQIEGVFFGHFNMLSVHKCSDRGIFGYISISAFCSLYFHKEGTSEAHVFFFKVFQILCRFPKWSKKFRKYFFWNNSIRIGCVRHLLLLRENTCHRVSVCEQTVSRFQILLKQNFSSWFRFRVIKKYEKNSGLKISVVFPTV